MASAPDWNVARNRYRGSPLPIWENVADPEDRMSIANLDELFHLTKTGSKNLTKNLFIRHGRTNFNDEKKVDALGDSVLTELGQEQSQNLVAKLEHLKAEKSDLIFVLSPLQRTRQTIKPTLLSRFSESEVTAREKQYYAISEQYRAAFADRSLQERLQGADDQVVFQLGAQIFVDWRLTDHLSFADQARFQPCDLLNRKDPSKPIGIDGETITQNSSRVKNALKYWNNKEKTQTLIFVSHADTIGLARQAFRNFDYAKQRKIFLPKNAEIKVHYWDNDRNAEVDLHKPYVDNYRGIQNGKTYKRTSEVLDCWFESGSMPFGQDHYLGEDSQSTCKLHFLRHGQSLYNFKMQEQDFREGYDYRDVNNTLSEQGKNDAKLAVSEIEEVNQNKDSVIYVSLLPRAVETVDPYFEKNYGWKLSTHPTYQETLTRFQKAYEN